MGFVDVCISEWVCVFLVFCLFSFLVFALFYSGLFVCFDLFFFSKERERSMELDRWGSREDLQ